MRLNSNRVKRSSRKKANDHGSTAVLSFGNVHHAGRNVLRFLRTGFRVLMIALEGIVFFCISLSCGILKLL
jgi:hypothetical protein